MFFVIIAEIFTPWTPININLFWLTLSVSQWYLMSIAFDFFNCFVQDSKCCGAICAERRLGLDVAQFSECNSDWGATLGVLKAPSSF
jgi:hypothetical protein